MLLGLKERGYHSCYQNIGSLLKWDLLLAAKFMRIVVFLDVDVLMFTIMYMILLIVDLELSRAVLTVQFII